MVRNTLTRLKIPAAEVPAAGDAGGVFVQCD